MFGRITLIVCLIVILVAAVLAGVAASFLRAETIYSGVRVAGTDLGGLSVTDAEARLSPIASSLADKDFALHLGEEVRATTFHDIGGAVDIAKTARAAYGVGRNGNVLHRVSEIVSARRHGLSVPVAYSFDRDVAERCLTDLARKADRKPINASLVIEGGSISVIPEKSGIKLDVAKSLERLTASANAGAGEADLIIAADKPDVTSDDLQGIDGVLGSCSTPYHAYQRDRTHNLKIACREINGTLVKPGEVFSYNKVVGPRLRELGFRDAPMFVDGQVEPGTGGGVCQVSTTVYNAALLADMKILRRSHHSRPVVYAPVGRDATVAYPAVDLKFENTSDAPIYIAASVGKRTVDVTIFGRKVDGRKIQLVSAGHSVYGAPVTRKIRESGKPAKPVVLDRGMAGHRISTYRVISQDGAVVKRELVSNDYYRPVARVVQITKVNAPSVEPAADEAAP